MDWFWCRTPGNNVMYSLYQRDTLYTIYTFPAPFGDQECTCINVINNLYLITFAIKLYVNWYRSFDWETLRDITPLWSNGQNGVFSPIFYRSFQWTLAEYHSFAYVYLWNPRKSYKNTKICRRRILKLKISCKTEWEILRIWH